MSTSEQPVPVEQLSYTEASRELDAIVDFFRLAVEVVEGACRHLVKDRMERTGMRRAAVREDASDVGPTSHLPQWRVGMPSGTST